MMVHFMDVLYSGYLSTHFCPGCSTEHILTVSTAEFINHSTVYELILTCTVRVSTGVQTLLYSKVQYCMNHTVRWSCHGLADGRSHLTEQQPLQIWILQKVASLSFSTVALGCLPMYKVLIFSKVEWYC